MGKNHQVNENASKTTVASAITKKEVPLAPSPSLSEAKAIADAQNRMAGRRPRIEASVKSEDGVTKISAPHSDTPGFVTQLYDCFGTGSAAFAEHAIARLAAIISGKGPASPTQTEFNAVLAAIDGIRPTSEIEPGLKNL